MKLKHQSNAVLRIAFLGAIVFSIFVVEAFGPVRFAVGQERTLRMFKVRISEDGHSFVLGDSGKTFVPWGFNYLGE